MGLFRRNASVNIPIETPSQQGGVSSYLTQRAAEGTPYLPIGGGTLYETNAYLHLISQQYNLYYVLYLQERRYFTNLWRIEGCHELELIWDGVTKSAFDFGQVAVKKIGNNYVPFTIYKLKYKTFNVVESGEGIIVPPTNSIVDLEKMNKVPLYPEDSVFCKGNYNSYPALLEWQFYLKVLIDYLTVNNTNITWLAKKVILTVKNGSSERVAQELQSLTNPNTPYAIVNKGIGDGEKEVGDNKLETLSTPSNSQNEFWHGFREFQSWWYQHAGRRHNSSFKKERNVSSETEIADACFAHLEYEMKKYFVMFVRDWNKLFGFNAKLVRVEDDAVEYEEEGENDNNTNNKNV